MPDFRISHESVEESDGSSRCFEPRVVRKCKKAIQYFIRMCLSDRIFLRSCFIDTEAIEDEKEYAFFHKVLRNAPYSIEISDHVKIISSEQEYPSHNIVYTFGIFGCTSERSVIQYTRDFFPLCSV